MAKYIFVVDDILKDMESLFIYLHELLIDTTDQNTQNMLTSDQVKVFFLHICWDAKTQDGAKNEFDEIYSNVENRVTKILDEAPFQIEYHAILWESNSYVQSSSTDCSSEIFDLIHQLRGNETDYVVLMDVILNDLMDKDIRWLTEGNDIPTSRLYRTLTGDQCIPYSKYPKASILEKWVELAQLDEGEQVFKRIYLTRSRGVYLPLENKMHKILHIVREQN